MNRTVKLLWAAVLVLAVLVGVEAYIIQTNANISNEPEPIRVACVGDSLTRGTEYTLFLWDQLGAEYILSDFGVGGTTASMASDKPYMNQSAFQLAKTFQPDIVIVMLGTNDAGLDVTAEAFAADYVTLIRTFQALESKPDVFVVLPPPIVNSTSLSNNKLTATIIPATQTVADQTGAAVADAYTPMLNHADDYTDGVHPDADGAQIIADAIYSRLSQAGHS